MKSTNMIKYKDNNIMNFFLYICHLDAGPSAYCIATHTPHVNNVFFCKETCASVKKLYTRNLKQQNEKKKRKITNQAILKLFPCVTDLLNGVNV